MPLAWLPPGDKEYMIVEFHVAFVKTMLVKGPLLEPSLGSQSSQDSVNPNDATPNNTNTKAMTLIEKNEKYYDRFIFLRNTTRK